MAGRKILSIEVGNILTKVCEIDYHKKSPKIYQCIVFPTPENTVEDGYIRNKEQFVETIKAELIKANIKTRDVVFTINSAKITSREVSIPYVNDKRISDVINANLSEYFPMNLEDYTIAHFILEKKKTQEDRSIRLLVIAAPNNLLKNYYNVAELLGLSIESIDYIGNSVFQIIKKQTAPGVQMVLQLNEESSIVYLIENTTLLFQRTIPYGVDGAIASVIESKCYAATNALEALDLLSKEHILNGHMNLEIDKSETAATYIGSEELFKRQMEELDAKDDATNALSYLINNVVRMEEYCNAKFKDKKINNIYLTGIGSKLRGIHKLINNEVGIDVKKIERLIGISFRMNTTQLDEVTLLATIGAAMKPLDFIPDEVKKQKEKQDIKIILWGVGVSAIVSLALIIFSHLQYNNSNERLDNLRREEKQLAKLEVINQQHEQMKMQSDTMRLLYASLQSPNNNLVSLIEKLEKIFPKKAYVKSLQTNLMGIDITVSTSSKEEVADMIKQIEKLDEVLMVNVGTITESKGDSGITVIDTSFSIYTIIKTNE